MAEYIKFNNQDLQNNDLYLEHWLVNEGDFVTQNQQIASVRNGNRIYIVRAPINGFFLSKSVKNGEKFSSGENLGRIVTKEEASQKTITDTLSSTDIKILKQINKPLRTKHIRKPVHVKASPKARSRAREYHIDLEKVIGTGPKGRIQLRDVNLYIHNMENPVTVNRLTNKSIQYGLPLTGIARRIARKHNLDSSKIPVPPNIHRIRREDVERYLRNPEGAAKEIEKEYNIFQLSDLENPIVNYSDLVPAAINTEEEASQPEVIRLSTDEESFQESGDIIDLPQIFVYPDRIEGPTELFLSAPNELNEGIIRLFTDEEITIPSDGVIILSTDYVPLPMLMDVVKVLSLIEPDHIKEATQKPIRLSSEEENKIESDDVIELEQTQPVTEEGAIKSLRNSKTSKVPKASSVPKASNLPKVSSVPKTSKVPKASRIPKASKVPKVSRIPRASQVPKVSSVPKASKVPKASPISKVSTVPEVSKVPKASFIPKVSVIPGASVVPKVNVAPKEKVIDKKEITVEPSKDLNNLSLNDTEGIVSMSEENNRESRKSGQVKSESLISKLIRRNRLSQELKNSRSNQSKSDIKESPEKTEPEITPNMTDKEVIDIIQGLTGNNYSVIENELDSMENKINNIKMSSSNIGHLSTLVNLNLLELIKKHNPPVSQIGSFSKNYILSTIYYVFEKYFGSNKPSVYYFSSLKDKIITSYSSTNLEILQEQLKDNQGFYKDADLKPGDLIITELLSYNLSSVSNIIDTDKQIVLYLTYIKNLDSFSSKDLGINSILEISLDFDTEVLDGIEAIEFIEELREELEKLEVH